MLTARPDINIGYEHMGSAHLTHSDITQFVNGVVTRILCDIRDNALMAGKSLFEQLASEGGLFVTQTVND